MTTNFKVNFIDPRPPEFSFAFAFVTLRVINSEIVLSRFAFISVSMASSANIFSAKFGEGFCPLRFYPVDLSEDGANPEWLNDFFPGRAVAPGQKGRSRLQRLFFLGYAR